METRQLHPLLVTAIFIVVFLEIHPFQDGNGRLSRILYKRRSKNRPHYAAGAA
jgi:Fic family protein